MQVYESINSIYNIFRNDESWDRNVHWWMWWIHSYGKETGFRIGEIELKASRHKEDEDKHSNKEHKPS